MEYAGIFISVLIAASASIGMCHYVQTIYLFIISIYALCSFIDA